MTRIVVPPERIQEISQQFAQASTLTSSMISNLNGQILSLQSRWAGITQERFFQEFQVARGQMESFTTSVASIGTELRSIAVKFAETDQTAGNGIHTDGNSQGQNPKETLSNLFNQGENAWSTANGIRGNLALAGTGMYSLLASTLVLTKTVEFKRSPKNPTRAVVHNAKWVNGKGPNTFLRNMARRMDKQFRNPGLVMKGLKGFDKLAGTLKMGKLGLGFSKANSFSQWTRNVVAGVPKGQYGMKISAIPKMIGKRLFPINVGLNVFDEGVKTVSKIKAGTLTGTDIAVSASNVVIKSAAAGAGAVAVGAIGGVLFGPVGAAVGAYVGGSAGAALGGIAAGVAEKGIKWVSGLFK
ncbi:WXG100 family type VII secretion target [Paenibacillus urinalis]|uniref:WXG100 family type VII secretion target n=1 Tax=Paenibacillus urinalis TaxID=521520 RepID=A0ABY7XF72_9BACL|nr:WXG100 family type VII secretion target [Paenibacillus urinalis]WDH99769.1 WXG100 family type VII secretion target [Paenibacillus urinalis]WDI03401.1 WXG100 family type VII secretion target [Paenibacillus urinalis]